MDTPVAFIIFNRPNTTERVFAEIAKAQPRKLFVIADGPRDDHPDDAQLCTAARAIIDRVDWQCDVLKDFSGVNLGCGRRQQTGIDWVFQQVDRCIILEDDNLPVQDFFPFCAELLERYADDERVMHINGTGFFPDNPSRRYSYFFSRSLCCWGWATWGRAWKHFDFEMRLWSELRDTPWLVDVLGDRRWAKQTKEDFEETYARAPRVSGKDQQWLFTCYSQNGLGIRPYSNLVRNIGSDNPTHPAWQEVIEKLILPTSSISFPLRHPPFVVRDVEADQFDINRFFKIMRSHSRRRWYRRQLRRLIPDRARNRIRAGRSV